MVFFISAHRMKLIMMNLPEAELQNTGNGLTKSSVSYNNQNSLHSFQKAETQSFASHNNFIFKG